MVDPKIFRQYDIRGVWERDLSRLAVEKIGRAFASYLKERLGKQNPRITIGGDARLSSPVIFEVLAGALTSSGVDVVDLGMCPTPVQYFSIFHLKADGGVMITGSHNPPEFNGMKLSLGEETLYGQYIQEIRKLVEAGASSEGKGSVEKYNIIPKYIEHLKAGFGRLDGIKAVLDCGNGTAGLAAPALIGGLGAEVVELFCEPDGSFPNHHPDPVVPENLKDLISAVRKEKAHLGIGFDGDSDRIGVVDEEGGIVWGDSLMIIFSRDILSKNPGASVIGEVKCSQTLYDDIASKGGRPVMWKTGHSLIKKKMKETGALLAGEMSGHIFFADRYFGYDDAIYAALRLLEILAAKGAPHSVKKLLEDVPPVVSTPEIRFETPDEVKFLIVEKVKESFRDYPVIDIDGVRVMFPEGWGLIRASNTQPALVMRFEAKDEESLKKIRGFVEGELKKLL